MTMGSHGKRRSLLCLALMALLSCNNAIDPNDLVGDYLVESAPVPISLKFLPYGQFQERIGSRTVIGTWAVWERTPLEILPGFKVTRAALHLVGWIRSETDVQTN